MIESCFILALFPPEAEKIPQIVLKYFWKLIRFNGKIYKHHKYFLGEL